MLIKTEYEMPEDYNQQLAKLLEMIETQKFYDNQIKYLQSWTNVDELRSAKAELEKSIEEFEQTLAKQFDAYQRFRAHEESLEQLLKNSSKNKLVIHE
jgi:exonuclease VII small subunit